MTDKNLAGAEISEVFTFPDLVSREFLAILLTIVVLCLWSLGMDAPLKAIADPNWTENPAKAPWYFVGLQELLVYFDPWIAGVAIPLFIIFGLMAIPYLDSNPAGVGTYGFKHRKFAISLFMLGYILWFALILLGQFLRGPNWQFYWPWQDWSVPKEAERKLWNLSGIWSYILIMSYFILGLWLPALIKPAFYKALGFARYLITWLLILLMFSLIIKIILRIFFHIKYILITPYFSI
ncbi:MAG: hypothetical protein HY911_13120 [Desulfobacterales bacterium]|nr:hypothetical protein [Desulfobacterales bacterium]